MREGEDTRMTVLERVRSEEDLRAELVKYAGQCVAVIDYRVVHSAATLDDLLERLDDSERERARVLRVSDQPNALHLY
jgi:hypothetical protein